MSQAKIALCLVSKSAIYLVIKVAGKMVLGFIDLNSWLKANVIMRDNIVKYTSDC